MGYKSFKPMERLDDMQPHDNPALRFPGSKGVEADWQHCPVCRGYGGWVLQANAYEPYDTTQEPPAGWTWDAWIKFYGPRQHFRASCSQCNGWGWVEAGSKDATCIHTMREMSSKEARSRGITHWGMCWHVYECTLCGRIESVDSSG